MPGWDELRQALLAAEAALGDVYLAIKVEGKAKDALETLQYARKQLEQRLPDGAEIPNTLVEAKRLHLMVKRFLKEMKK